ncbi:MAG: nucleotide sugar dehydrogenase, partial [Planctomycetota bacterium]
MSKKRKKNQTKAPIIGVIGMGYVGIPLALAFVRGGATVIGFDINTKQVEKINKGISPIKHIPRSSLQKALKTKRIRATNRMSELVKPDALLICVPTPLTENREPDMQYVIKCQTISRYLRKGQLVVLESTTYPGTSRDLMLPILEQKGLKAGRDFYLAYSPEREDPGNKEFDTTRIPKVVGGYDKQSLRKALEVYRYAIEELVPVGSCEIAEACKILENTYRCVNIAMVNELKQLFDRMGI